VLPFLTEEMYQNIVRSVSPGAPPSVHLLSYPEVDAERIDDALVARIDVVVKYRNLGLGLRNQSGLKVRQPLSRMVVCPADDHERTTLGLPALREQLLEELNVKRLEILDTTDGLIEKQVRPNFKTLGPRHGELMKKLPAALKDADIDQIARALDEDGSYRLEVEGQSVILGKEDVELVHSAPEGLVFVFEKAGFAALDVTLTPELEREGIARDFVRGVQNERKSLDLNMADRIRLRYWAPEGVRRAVEERQSYICRETLAVELSADPAVEEQAERAFKAGGSRVQVVVERVETP
jgi:isoleucyl-tRNA synthetase